MFYQKADKLTMDTDALIRKRDMAAKYPNAKVITVAINDRLGPDARVYYWKEGVGSFNVSAMTRAADLEDLLLVLKLAAR